MNEKIKRLADEYAHCYAFVGDDTMPIKRAELHAAIDEAINGCHLEKAEQQIYGWHLGVQDERLVSLISGMGLTKAEWEALKNGEQVNYLTDNERDDIDVHFDQEAKK